MVYMCHIFTTHLSIEGHLSCFYFLAIVNRAVVSMADPICIYGVEYHPLGICQGVIYLGHTVDFILNLCKLSTLVFRVAILIFSSIKSE